MPQQGSRRVSAPLTNVSVQYKNDEYIAEKGLSNLMVEHESDQYYVYNNNFQIEQSRRANGDKSARATFDVSTSTYTLQEYALHDVITDRDRKNADSVLKLDADATEYLTDKIQLQMEKDVADLLFTTTSWSNNTTLTTATSWFENTTTSAPIQNVLSATTAIVNAGGGRANKMWTNLTVHDALKENTQLHERLKYVQKSILTKEIMASMFDLDEMLVGTAVYNTAKEGAAASLTQIWEASALVGNFKENPGLKNRTAATMIRLKGGIMGGNKMQVQKRRDDDIRGDKIEVSTFYEPKLIATSSAYFFKSAALQ